MFINIRDKFCKELERVSINLEKSCWDFYTNSTAENLKRYEEAQDEYSKVFQNRDWYNKFLAINKDELSKHEQKQLKELLKEFDEELNTGEELKALRKKENELLHQIDRGRRISSKSAKTTLNEYFDNWLELYAKSGRKATTCTNYKSYYNTYIRETIGKKPITKVSKADIQKIINDMVRDGKKHSTLANLKSCLNIVCDCAVDDDIIVKNPVKNIQLPQTESEKREPVPEEHIKIFLEYVRNSARYSYSYPAFLVLFNTGMRIGELAALTWEDVDTKAGEIHINKSLNRKRLRFYSGSRKP